MEGEVGQASGLFATVGGALFRRAVHLLENEAAAVRAVEDLFIRFVVYGRGQTLDARARWAWIYRVATTHCLRQLPDDVRPGSQTAGQAATAASVPRMDVLRRFDEATRTIVVLAALDGLAPDEIAEVVGLPAQLVRRRIGDSANGPTPGAPSAPAEGRHPSLLALDRDRSSHVDHLAGCARCREAVEVADGLARRFARDIAPGITVRVAAAIRAENARRTSGPGWKRALWLGGGLILVSSLALLVARPRAPDRADVPYAGLKGASRATGSGIQITLVRGAEVRGLAPGMVLRSGDHLRFRVRSERPRYLELRVRDAGGDARVFPESGSGSDAVMVRPGQALDRDYVVRAGDPGGGGGGGGDGRGGAGETAAGKPGRSPSDRFWIVGLFADHPFALDRAPGPDTEVVPVRVEVQP